MPAIKVGIVDDHRLLRNALSNYLKQDGYDMVFQADNGLHMIELLNPDNLPDVILMDINMPEMNGYDATLWLRKNLPKILVVGLSMYDSEEVIIRMLTSGARGFLIKDSEPDELKNAIDQVYEYGIYPPSKSRINPQSISKFSRKEIKLIQLLSSELTYTEIIRELSITPRKFEKLLDEFREKFKIKHRIDVVCLGIACGVENSSFL